ncbi:hypothetical protein FS749_010529 [Ceratobasidium sp. UAMH 11750]|nr:hypothetical protein FS749_010529 [Ceratobasidium sp. UAMH 11750]
MKNHYPSDQVPDSRVDLPISQKNWQAILHAVLAGLAPMVSQMHRYIHPKWAYRSNLSDEHVHEALRRLLLMEIVRIDESGKDMVLAVGVRSMPNSTPPALSNQSQSTTSLRITAPRSHSGTKDLLEPPHMSSEKDVALDGPAPSRKRGSSYLDQEPARRSPRLVGPELEHRAPGTSTPGKRTPHEQLVD